MKTMTMTEFGRAYQKNLSKAPKEGLAIKYKGQCVAYVYPVPVDQLRVETAKKAEASIEKQVMQVDTFTTKEPPEATTLGNCHRCGRNGTLVKRNYINDHNTMEYGKFICKENCFLGKGKIPGKRHKSTEKETTFNDNRNQSDFGGMSVNKTF